MMRKINKNKMTWGWKFVVGAVAICGSAVLICFGAKVWERIDRLEKSEAAMFWEMMGASWFDEVHVSDDRKWYLIPEVGVRFPFFSTFENAEVVFMGRPLLYNVNYFLPSDGSDNKGWQVALTYDVMDDSFIEDFPEGPCMAPFVLEYNFYYQDEDEISEWQMKEYRIVNKMSLANGREVTLRERTEGKKCLEFIDSAHGEFIKSQLGKLESY